jgi:hypothetical protein
MGPHVFFVSKDMGSANVAIPVTKLMENYVTQKGGQVSCIIEGLAAERFEKAGFEPYFKGTVNFRTEPLSLQCGESFV